MTTKIIFRDDSKLIIQDGEFACQTGESRPGEPKGHKDKRLGTLIVRDDERHGFATIGIGPSNLAVSTVNHPITREEFLKKHPWATTEVKEVIYLGKERRG